MSWAFFIWVCNWRKNKREFIIENIKEIERDKKLIFKNRKQLEKWYKNEFNKKIVI